MHDAHFDIEIFRRGVFMAINGLICAQFAVGHWVEHTHKLRHRHIRVAAAFMSIMCIGSATALFAASTAGPVWGFSVSIVATVITIWRLLDMD